MKIRILYILFVLLVSCSKERVIPDVRQCNLELSLTVPYQYTNDIQSFEGVVVYVKNSRKDYVFTAMSNAEGKVVFSNIEPGFYVVNIGSEIVGVNDIFVLNGNKSIELFSSLTVNVDLEVNVIQVEGAGFVIKEFYYSGCLTPAGNNYTDDQFIEIYNNSADTLYADSLLIVEHESYGYEPNYWSYMASDSIVVKMIWAFPQSVGLLPVAPGAGIIIARDAFDHKSDPNGNPLSSVDLANAGFEFWSDKNVDSDIDYRSPNMVAKLWTFKGNDVSFHTRGGSAMAIVKIPGNVDEFVSQNLVVKEGAISANQYFCKIPNKWVIDAVEVTWNDKLYKRFHNSLDAGSVFVEAGSLSGFSIRRKVRRIINGRVVYEDTNNSNYDFEHDVVPTPGIYLQ